ncbi:GDSL-type esterase/lipase family protein [Limosilactobacillus galli]|uniref:GDSL-type esterase/lipase family protein n=1 Tax=Limosilactobacillus galli TaxID=2991834 RepID=UPI0024BA0B91|nr:GDSL-type esterase/lipase family protein [Limosilactobacillus galli]
MRITVDLAKASTEPVDLTGVLNPRVGDGDLKLPFHLMYNGDDEDMRGKSMDFLSEGSDKKKIYVSGTVDESTKGDDPYTGNVTFTFPTGTFKTPGAYDVDKTMFRVVNNDDHSVISTVNVKMNVLPNDSDVDSSDDVSYDSRMEKIMKDYSDKGQASLNDAKQKAQQIIDDANKQATDYLNGVKKQGDDLLDEIKQTNSEAKGNVAGDTAATATQAKQLANDNSGKIHDLQGEVGDARGRFMTLSDRENKQDFNIDRKEDKSNANANYAALQQKDAQQDASIATKARQDFVIDYLSKMDLQPEAFENEAALEAKYPNGNPGIMVTVDTGHMWLYVSGAWKDCGQYQGLALAASDRQQLDNALVGNNVLADASSEPYNDLNTLPVNRIVTYDSDISSVQNAPVILSGSSNGATVVTMSINPKAVSGAVQMLFNSNGDVYYRVAWGYPAAYESWHSIRSGNYIQYSGANVPHDVYKDLNTFPANSEVLITDNIGDLKNIPSQLVGTSYSAAISTESVGTNDSGTIQKVFVVDTNDIYERIVWGGENAYHPWRLLADGDFYKSGKMTNVKTGSPYDDLNTFPTGQTVTIAETPDKIKQIKNLPPISNITGGLTVRTESSINDTLGGIQIAIDNNNVMYHRICWGASGQWGAWRSDSVDEHSNDMILPTLSLFQKVGVVGDSYASGELAFDGKYVDHYEISWLQILARKDGFTGTNFSKGGMSTRTWLTNPKCLPLMQSSDAQDFYILALGINDEALGVSYIGSEADIDTGSDTFYGNYGKIIKAIQTKAPQAKLVIATIADSSDIATKFNEAITTIANHFTIPVIVQLDDPLFNSSFYKDNMVGGHPTGPVYASMAEAFERLIGQSMIDHLDYYKTFRK